MNYDYILHLALHAIYACLARSYAHLCMTTIILDLPINNYFNRFLYIFCVMFENVQL